MLWPYDQSTDQSTSQSIDQSDASIDKGSKAVNEEKEINNSASIEAGAVRKIPDDPLPKNTREEKKEKNLSRQKKKEDVDPEQGNPPADPGRDSDKRVSFFWELTDLWIAYNQEHFGRKVSYDQRGNKRILKGRDCKSLKDIMLELQHRETEPWTLDVALTRFRSFLDAASSNDTWLRKNFLLHNLEHQFDIIHKKSNGYGDINAHSDRHETHQTADGGNGRSERDIPDARRRYGRL